MICVQWGALWSRSTGSDGLPVAVSPAFFWGTSSFETDSLPNGRYVHMKRLHT